MFEPFHFSKVTVPWDIFLTVWLEGTSILTGKMCSYYSLTHTLSIILSYYVVPGTAVLIRISGRLSWRWMLRTYMIASNWRRHAITLVCSVSLTYCDSVGKIISLGIHSRKSQTRRFEMKTSTGMFVMTALTLLTWLEDPLKKLETKYSRRIVLAVVSVWSCFARRKISADFLCCINRNVNIQVYASSLGMGIEFGFHTLNNNFIILHNHFHRVTSFRTSLSYNCVTNSF